MAFKPTVNRFIALVIALLISGFGLVIVSIVLYERKETGLATAAFIIGALECAIGLVVGDAAGKVVMGDDVMPQSESAPASK